MKEKIYFPGLNGLRFFAAMSVVIFHLGITEIFGKSRKDYFLSQLFLDGGDAVTLFFVLSGFLITYLLLVELKRLGTIQIRKFYLRRILRIWPLYYFIVILGFTFFPWLQRVTETTTLNSLNNMSVREVGLALGAHLLLQPHVSTYFNLRVDAIEQVWSIGIEETFYLMWPVLVLVFRKRILALLLSLIGIKLFLNIAAVALSRWGAAPDWFTSILGLINYIRVENMAIGGLGAYILFTNRERLLKIIFHPVVEKGTLLLIILNIFVISEAHHSYGVRIALNFFLCIIYTLLILNVSCNPRSTIKLEYPIFNKLGRISYGIYMYHLLVMFTFAALFSKSIYLTNDSPLLTLSIYIIVPLLSIGIAQLSYTYFEQPFLRMKTRYTVVKSGDAEPVESAVPAPLVSN